MVLRLVQIPDPNDGTDWSYVVPGQYLERITGIYARLSTFSQDPTAPMVDNSGNGNNGVYGNGSIVGDTFVAGVVPGDQALRVSMNNIVGSAPLVSDPLGGDFTLGFWFEPETTSDDVFWGALTGSVNPTVRFFVTGNSFGNLFQVDRQYAAGMFQNFRAGTAPLSLGPNFAVAVFRAASTTMDFYLNGTHFTSNVQPVQAMTETSDAATFGATAVNTFGTWDEIFLIPAAISAGDVATLYAAGLSDWNTWNADLLALSPFFYYPLNDISPGGGRQVTLVVTNGNATVAQIPTGFPEVSANGPYFYSWQPGLNASTQTNMGDLTTVAIPPLILPAGYSIGTDTLDLGPFDFWIDVTIWWDDNIMESLTPTSPFVYPPGAFLVYEQVVPPA